MKKLLLILCVCYLVVTLVPAFAVVNGENLAANTGKVDQNNDKLVEDNNEISSDINALDYHSKILRGIMDQMNDIKWYQFWKINFLLFEGPAKIKEESAVIESLSNNINKSSSRLEQNANDSLKIGMNLANSRLDEYTNDNIYNTGDVRANVDLIASKLSSQFKTNYTVTGNENLSKGDIVQFPLSHGNYVYLQYVGMNPTGDKALFLGDSNTAVRLAVSQLNTIAYKISPARSLNTKTATSININTNFNTTTKSFKQNSATSEQMSYIANIQMEGLKNYTDTKINYLNDQIKGKNATKSTGTNLMIAGGVIEGASLALVTVAAILIAVSIGTRATLYLVAIGLFLLIGIAALSIIGLCEMGVKPIEVAAGMCGLLSTIFGIVSGTLLLVGGSMYGYANSGINDLNNQKIAFENESNSIETDLYTYYNGSSDNLPVSQSITIDMEQNNKYNGCLNATDVDGDELLYSAVKLPSNGTLKVDVDGTFTYTPSNGFVGNDSFNYIVSDIYGDSNETTVNVTVHPFNHPPISTNKTFDIETNNNLTDQLTATDADNDQISFNLINSTPNGTLTLNKNGTFSYTPYEGFIGNISFTYRASDWNKTGNIATVNINVHPPNHLPVASYTTFRMPENENMTGTIMATDSDGDNIFYKLVSHPLNGTLTLNSDGTFTYIPRKGFVGRDLFTFKAKDWQGESNLGTITINIYEFNHPAVAQNISFTTNKNKKFIGLFNTTDIDIDKLTFKIIQKPQHGTVNMLRSGKFIYTPTSKFTGNDKFTYRTYDGKTQSNIALVSIKVLNRQLNIDEYILTKTNDDKNKQDANSDLKNILTPKTFELPDAQDKIYKYNQTNVTPNIDQPEKNILDKNNILTTFITLFKQANDYINKVIKQLTLAYQLNRRVHLRFPIQFFLNIQNDAFSYLIKCFNYKPI